MALRPPVSILICLSSPGPCVATRTPEPRFLCAHPTPFFPQAIIYVVDSTDTERISISRDEFHNILTEEELKDALILVYANKQVRRMYRGQDIQGAGQTGRVALLLSGPLAW